RPIFGEACVQDRKDATHDTLCCQRWRIYRRLALPLPLPDQGNDLREHVLASLERPGSGREALHDQQASRLGITLQRLQQCRQACTCPLPPPTVSSVGG